jgi:hydrogenase nickel incorporation protein HypB
MNPRIVEVRQNILRKNDILARTLRSRFDNAGVFVVSLLSSPGSGKTALLEQTLTALRPERSVAALVGDLATERDAARLRNSGAPVRQITTGTICHLDAEMVDRALTDWDLSSLDTLFIENVGNLVCPASYDIGEHVRVVMLSVTEGEDKPLKYPTIFNTADLVLITKMDLAQATEFDLEQAMANLETVRPGVRVLTTSARSRSGLATWLDWLKGTASHRRSFDRWPGNSLSTS